MENRLSRAEKRAATAARILEAAQAEFGAHGADGASIRGIAKRAEVDPSLVLQHYGSKQALFALAVRPAADLRSDDVPAHLAEVLEVRLRELPPATRALMRSMLTSPEAAAVMSDYLNERATNLAKSLPGADAEARAALVTASILGITIARHFLNLSALADLTADQISAVTDSWFDSLDVTVAPGPPA
ncbi:TetR/AcrR family transcriptional regulator [Curtobacterium sp. MCPF17_047]|uniref:TetR/AcrR family transcriptional regulator n=1 Tax=Curtobacterium sp. MCPF17_047 TaxID=2175654 RepID=UPI000DA7F714|nr:TetR/AcrR family transcriptional regulator [Curtobacterium sp. MCPF17_047]PZF66975.1 TetR/AcrR family transcriptional regulator [Curtobacterium sp. MCPF17_047]